MLQRRWSGEDGSWHPRARARVEDLCQRCVQDVAVDGGGVSLVSAAGHRATVCATDDVAAVIEERQFTLGEGPCVDAVGSLSPVLIADLQEASEGVSGRWPGFLHAVEAVGVRATFAFPLRIGAIALGAVDLYRLAPGELSAAQLRAALLAADALAVALLDLTLADGQAVDDARDHSGYRMQVHAAAGMAMVQLGSTIDQALLRLRATAYASGRRIEEVAADVVDGRLRFHPEEPS